MIPKRDIDSEGQLLNSQFADFPPPLAYFKLLDAGEKRTEAQRPSACGSFTSLAPWLFRGNFFTWDYLDRWRQVSAHHYLSWGEPSQHRLETAKRRNVKGRETRKEALDAMEAQSRWKQCLVSRGRLRTLAREAKVQTREKRRGSFCSGVHTPSRYGFKKRQAIATLTVNTDGIYVFWSLNVSPLCDAVALPRCTWLFCFWIIHLRWNPECGTWKTHAHLVCNRESMHGSGTAIVSNSISNNSNS